jgi:hypothetical protein
MLIRHLSNIHQTPVKHPPDIYQIPIILMPDAVFYLHSPQLIQTCFLLYIYIKLSPFVALSLPLCNKGIVINSFFCIVLRDPYFCATKMIWSCPSAPLISEAAQPGSLSTLTRKEWFWLPFVILVFGCDEGPSRCPNADILIPGPGPGPVLILIQISPPAAREWGFLLWYFPPGLRKWVAAWAGADQYQLFLPLFKITLPSTFVGLHDLVVASCLSQ